MRVSFTGHRPQQLGGFRPNPTQTHVKMCLRKVIEAVCIKHPNSTFITGGALGVDQWAAEIVIDLRVKYAARSIIARPFPNQGGDRWPQASKDHLQYLCDMSDDVKDVSEVNPKNYGQMVKMMNDRNEWMVDNSDWVIAVWSGKKKGGTYNCYSYARRQGKPVGVIDPFNNSRIIQWKE